VESKIYSILPKRRDTSTPSCYAQSRSLGQHTNVGNVLISRFSCGSKTPNSLRHRIPTPAFLDFDAPPQHLHRPTRTPQIKPLLIPAASQSLQKRTNPSILSSLVNDVFITSQAHGHTFSLSKSLSDCQLHSNSSLSHYPQAWQGPAPQTD
jgi:hypothetical protein